jgi:peptidoglycan biosynthesis protein MviN/MurJ (putative lipid II flippase)
MIHPDPATGTEVLLMKIVLVCALIGMVIGAIKGWVDRTLGIFDVFLFGILGCLVGAFIPTFIMVCISAIALILS